MSVMGDEDPLYSTTLIEADSLPALKPGQDVTLSLKGLGAIARKTGAPILYIGNALDYSTKKEMGYSEYMLRHDGIWYVAYAAPIKPEQAKEQDKAEVQA